MGKRLFVLFNIRYSEEELQVHIDKLHEYNEIKDIGQLLIGKLGKYQELHFPGNTELQMVHPNVFIFRRKNKTLKK